LPFYSIYNIYELRLLQVAKLQRKYPDGKCSHLIKIHLSNLERERLEMRKRIVELQGEDITDSTSEEFDQVIKTIFKNMNGIFDERSIKSDFSYNLAHFDQYRSYAISSYNN
jgi:hypothetical protein